MNPKMQDYDLDVISNVADFENTMSVYFVIVYWLKWALSTIAKEMFYFNFILFQKT